VSFDSASSTNSLTKADLPRLKLNPGEILGGRTCSTLTVLETLDLEQWDEEKKEN
jgi:hypothetical protein